MNLSVSESQGEPTSSDGAPASADAPQPKARMAGPVQPGQRIQTIDILRGFAIFGILLVNMEFFNQSALNLAIQVDSPATLLDQLARWFIAFSRLPTTRSAPHKPIRSTPPATSSR